MVKHAETHPSLDVEGCFGCKISNVRFAGLVSMKVLRDYGKTGREVAKENIEEFRKRKGYDPVPVGDKSRWL